MRRVLAVNRDNALIIEMPGPKILERDERGLLYRTPRFLDPCPDLIERDMA